MKLIGRKRHTKGRAERVSLRDKGIQRGNGERGVETAGRAAGRKGVAGLGRGNGGEKKRGGKREREI